MNPRRVDNLNVPEDTKLTDKRSEFFFFLENVVDQNVYPFWACGSFFLFILGLWARLINLWLAQDYPWNFNHRK